MNPGTPPEQPHDTSSAKPSWRAQASCPSRSEQAMRLAILAGRIGTWDWEFATGQIIWSEMHEQLWGMAPGSFQGTYSEFAARVHPDDRPGLEAAVRHAIGELIPYDHEYRVIWPDGTVLWIAGHGEVFCDEEGRPVRMMGIVRDITDRKAAEEELRKTKTNLELAQAHAHLGSWELNVTTGTGTWSQEMFHLFDHETARGAPAFGEFIEMIHPEDRPTLLEKHDLAARTNEEISLEFRTNPARGAVKHLNATFYASHDSHGRMTQLSGTVLDVTRYKKIEAALRESEERYRDVLENAHDLIQSVAPDGRFLFVNRAWREMLGYSAEEVARLNLFDIIPARAQAHCRALFAQALSGDSPGPVEAIFTTKGGCEILVEGSVSSKLEFGKVTALRCIFRDVTRRKRTEEALRASEEKFRQLAENIREVFWMTDVAKNEMIYVSPGYETIWGRSCASLYESPRSWLDSIYSEDRSRVLNAATSQQVSGRYDVEYRIVRADGSMRWIHDKAFPVRNESGEVYRIVGIAEDITELKQAEAELQRSEKHFRSLIENAQDLITLVDAQGVIRFQSPSSLPLMGYAPAQLRDRNAFALIHPEDLGMVRAALERAFREPDQPVAAAFRFRHGDGSWRHLEAIGKRLMGEEPPLVVINSRDTTEHRHLEERLRQSQKMEAIGQLAGGVAHDFNNILTVILMQVELAGSFDGVPTEALEFLSEIRTSAEKAADLTRQLLAFSRQQVMRPRVVDLNQVVSHLAKLLQRILRDDVRLNIDLDGNPPHVHADPGMLDQILMNLAVNARDAMPSGGSVTIQTARETVDASAMQSCPEAVPGEFARVTVRDTGCGIPAEDLPHIFEPFFTTKEIGKGTGLGLATVYGIVKQHNGWIKLDSTVGQGTSFHIYLPLALPPSAERKDPHDLRSLGRGTETILLVEDEAAVREMACMVLERIGYRVLTAANGPAALEMRRQFTEPIPLLITDMIMPGGMTGLELAECMRLETPELKVLCTSGYSEALFRAQTDAIRFLQKPYHPKQLAEAVRATLEGSHATEKDQ